MQKEMTFLERVAYIEEFAADPWWRMQYFGRPIVEREIGHELPMRERVWTIELPGGWKSTLRSERKRFRTGEWLNSVPMPPDAKFTLET